MLKRKIITSIIFVMISLGLINLKTCAKEIQATPVPTEIVKITEHIAKVNPTTPVERIAVAIYNSAKQCNVNPYLVTAVMDTESRFRVDAVSETGARGLMQIIKSTAAYIGLPWDMAYDIELNTEKGACYLAKHVQTYHNRLDLAVSRYNGNDDPQFAKKVLSKFISLEANEYQIIVVKKGDTLAKLAEIYMGNSGMYPILAAQNGIVNPDLIEVGQKLIVRYRGNIT